MKTNLCTSRRKDPASTDDVWHLEDEGGKAICGSYSRNCSGSETGVNCEKCQEIIERRKNSEIPLRFSYSLGESHYCSICGARHFLVEYRIELMTGVTVLSLCQRCKQRILDILEREKKRSV